MLYSAFSKLECFLRRHRSEQPVCFFSNDILIVFSHHEYHDTGYDLDRSDGTLTGLSIGLLAAAAVSVSSSLAEIALNGVESVRIAFRLGVHVDGVSQSLESRKAADTPESWAYVVTGLPVEEIREEIERYNKESVSS